MLAPELSMPVTSIPVFTAPRVPVSPAATIVTPPAAPAKSTANAVAAFTLIVPVKAPIFTFSAPVVTSTAFAS